MDNSGTQSDELLCQSSLPPDNDLQAPANEQVKQEPVEDLDRLTVPAAKYLRLCYLHAAPFLKPDSSSQDAIWALEEWAMTMFEEIVNGYDKSASLSCTSRSKLERQLNFGGSPFHYPAGALKVAELSHLALKDDVPTTKRDIFYSDVELFGKQSVSDAETLIPVGEDIVNVNIDEDLATGDIPNLGKGYPDLATRQLVSVFSSELPECIPILCLVDADPHGMDILSVYKFGSKTLVHEDVAAERVQWIGVKRADIKRLGIPSLEMLKTTSADIRKAENMLRSQTLPSEWVEELEQMLQTGTKAEIEVISGRGEGALALVKYVCGKILEALALDSEDGMIELSDPEDTDIVIKEEAEDLIDLDDLDDF
ncbi:topoisomerase acting in meiosis protein [Rhizoctonia solani]|uniref:DNA topoisomerase (ATP-hydrolyzing) n=1 Tax=Rhizoctonia solani TaxID=456999 RepID=A0A8H8NQM9_9AGAM|nr:topoisomerase acting in meiosis protein [Rhizoctonia solani]QRW17710.1 topoisomerase acting in meiosis protein [Rhizoctonia solani]